VSAYHAGDFCIPALICVEGYYENVIVSIGEEPHPVARSAEPTAMAASEGCLNILAVSIRTRVQSEAYGSEGYPETEVAPDAAKGLGAFDERTAKGDTVPAAPGGIGGRAAATQRGGAVRCRAEHEGDCGDAVLLSGEHQFGLEAVAHGTLPRAGSQAVWRE
jgi:hypothetical protein